MGSPDPDGLKVALVLLEMSQIKLASDLRIHPSTISRIVNGWYCPPADVQKRILDAVYPHAQDFPFGWQHIVSKAKKDRP